MYIKDSLTYCPSSQGWALRVLPPLSFYVFLCSVYMYIYVYMYLVSLVGFLSFLSYLSVNS